MYDDYEIPLQSKLLRDVATGLDMAKILPGEYFAASRHMLITTVLGSCVSACIYDRKMGMGGMNHFMLPDGDCSDDPSRATSGRYGVFAMEVLINTLLKMGARRNHLEAKVFGGGNVLQNLTYADVGTRNSQFVKEFLALEGIPIVAEDLLGEDPRKVLMYAATGKVMVKRLGKNNASKLVERESTYRHRLDVTPKSGEVELF